MVTPRACRMYVRSMQCIAVLALIISLLSLAACSGGGDGGGAAAGGGTTPGGSGGGSTATLADTLLFYNSLTPVPPGTTPLPTDGTLHALDPANPTNPITVDSGLSSVVYVGLLAGTYTGSTKTLSNLIPTVSSIQRTAGSTRSVRSRPTRGRRSKCRRKRAPGRLARIAHFRT